MQFRDTGSSTSHYFKKRKFTPTERVLFGGFSHLFFFQCSLALLLINGAASREAQAGEL